MIALKNTFFDSLDFASEDIGLAGRLAIDATKKIDPENHNSRNPLISLKNSKTKIMKYWYNLDYQT